MIWPLFTSLPTSLILLPSNYCVCIMRAPILILEHINQVPTPPVGSLYQLLPLPGVLFLQTFTGIMPLFSSSIFSNATFSMRPIIIFNGKEPEAAHLKLTQLIINQLWLNLKEERKKNKYNPLPLIPGDLKKYISKLSAE